MDAGAAEARGLAQWAATVTNVQIKIRAAQIASYALRSAGHLSEAYAVALEGYDTALRHNLSRSIAALSLRLSGIAYVDDRLDEADEWLIRAEEQTRQHPDFLSADVLGMRIRIGVRRGTPADVKGSLGEFIHATLSNQTARCRAERWGYITRARLACEDYVPEQGELVEASLLAESHLNACWADHFIAAVCEAYVARGELRSSTTLLSAYVQRRRDRFPLSWELREIAASS
jgi:hypothetical protein